MASQNGYRISSDARRSHLQLASHGVLDNDLLDSLERDFVAEIARLESAGHPRGTYLTLVDLRRQELQTQDVTRRIESSGMAYAAMSLRVAVIVSGSALQRLQVRRVAPADNHAVFDDEDKALDWLFGADRSH